MPTPATGLSLCNKAISMTWIFQCRRVKWLFPASWPCKYVDLYGARPLHYWDSGLGACRSSIPYSTCGMLTSRVIVPFLLLLHFPWLSLFYISLCDASGLYSQLLCMTVSYFEIRRSIINKPFFVPLSWFKLGFCY